MADRKISQLPAQTVFNGNDLLMIVDDPLGTPVSKSTTLDAMFGAVPSNTIFASTKGPVINTGDITLALPTTVSTNNANTEFGAGAMGTMVWDANYLYIAVSNTAIKRVALSVFS